MKEYTLFVDVYLNIKYPYRTVTLPHLSHSDHQSLLLLPAYTPLKSSIEPATKII